MKAILFLFAFTTVMNVIHSSEGNQKSAEDEKFVPTREWQVVKKGQKIPEGLHIRINFETGITEAKLLDKLESENPKSQAVVAVPNENNQEIPKDKFDTKESNVQSNMLLQKQIEDALKKINSDDPEDPGYAENIKDKFRTYSELKKELGDLHLTPQTDAEILKELVAKHQEIYRDKEMEDADILTLLEDFEFLVHQFDNAIEFVRLGGFKEIVYKNLNSTNAQIKMDALKIFGAALQNNVKIQIHALETGGLHALLRILALDSDATVKNRAVFALSGLLRRFPLAQMKFIEDAGLSVFSELFESDDIKLQLKLVTLIHDLLAEHSEAENDRAHIDYEQKIKQYRVVNFKKKILDYNFCEYVDKLLVNIAKIDNKDIDSIEKCLSVMVLVVDKCGPSYSHQLQELLQRLLVDFKKYSDEEKLKGEDYYTPLYDTVQNLIKYVKIIHKSEL